MFYILLISLELLDHVCKHACMSACMETAASTRCARDGSQDEDCKLRFEARIIPLQSPTQPAPLVNCTKALPTEYLFVQFH